MEQSALRDMWRGGPVGSMSPWSEVKALALRDAWCILEPGKERGMHQFIANHIEKVPLPLPQPRPQPLSNRAYFGQTGSSTQFRTGLSQTGPKLGRRTLSTGLSNRAYFGQNGSSFQFRTGL